MSELDLLSTDTMWESVSDEDERRSIVGSFHTFTHAEKMCRNPVNVHAGGNCAAFKKMILFSSGVRTADVSLKKSTVDRRDVFDEIYFFFFLILHYVYFDLF